MAFVPSKLLRLIIEATIGVLSIAIIGLIIKAFTILKHNDDLVDLLLPGGKLHAASIFGSSLTLAIICALGLCMVVINILSIALQTSRTRGPLLRKLQGNWLPACTLALLLILLSPTHLALTIIATSQSASVSALGLPESLIDSLLLVAHKSLRYRDIDVVVAYVVLGWILWTVVFVGSSFKKVLSSNTLTVEPPLNPKSHLQLTSPHVTMITRVKLQICPISIIHNMKSTQNQVERRAEQKIHRMKSH